jgi:hypothetical protein
MSNIKEILTGWWSVQSEADLSTIFKLTFGWTGECVLETAKYKHRPAWRLRQFPRFHGTWSVDESHSQGKVLSITWTRLEKRGLSEIMEAAGTWGTALGDAIYKGVLPPTGSSDFLLMETGPRQIVSINMTELGTPRQVRWIWNKV